MIGVYVLYMYIKPLSNSKRGVFKCSGMIDRKFKLILGALIKQGYQINEENENNIFNIFKHQNCPREA